MPKPIEVRKVLKDYEKGEVHIATIGSHSALNILAGARDEGLPTERLFLLVRSSINSTMSFLSSSLISVSRKVFLQLFRVVCVSCMSSKFHLASASFIFHSPRPNSAVIFPNPCL
ncbi:MAG: DUF1246 domain-containing protein [Candidatus Altiarchaeales archaeon]|nr:DUF1246 domain-containing protein [Candidatus Altiarchaeales archaeon]